MLSNMLNDLAEALKALDGKKYRLWVGVGEGNFSLLTIPSLTSQTGLACPVCKFVFAYMLCVPNRVLFATRKLPTLNRSKVNQT